MLRTIVLICALGTPPQDCTRNTALDVLPGMSVMICPMIAGQAQLASTALAPDATTYPMIRCERVRAAAK